MSFGLNLIRVRMETVVIRDGQAICGEYGAPGARIIFISKDQYKIYSPYEGDQDVYHIHSISHIVDDLYHVCVGDTAKYLDILKINEKSCCLVQREKSFLAGFTAMEKLEGNTWAGSDFSHRPNFIINLTSSKNTFFQNQHTLNI